MKVRIVQVTTGTDAPAEIREGTLEELPSIHDSWRFNFNRQIRKLKNSWAYVLVTEEHPGVIQGCMIFQLVDKVIPNMAFLEIAPLISDEGGRELIERYLQRE